MAPSRIRETPKEWSSLSTRRSILPNEEKPRFVRVVRFALGTAATPEAARHTVVVG
jgi:hypothetical protein